MLEHIISVLSLVILLGKYKKNNKASTQVAIVLAIGIILAIILLFLWSLKAQFHSLTRQQGTAKIYEYYYI